MEMIQCDQNGEAVVVVVYVCGAPFVALSNGNWTKDAKLCFFVARCRLEAIYDFFLLETTMVSLQTSCQFVISDQRGQALRLRQEVLH